MRSPTTTRRSRNGRKTRCSIFPFASCSVLVPFSRFSSPVRSHKVDLKQNKQTKKLGAATVFGHLKYCARVLVGIGASILGHFPFVPHYTHIPPFTSWILSLSLFRSEIIIFLCAPYLAWSGFSSFDWRTQQQTHSLSLAVPRVCLRLHFVRFYCSLKTNNNNNLST